MKKAFKKIVSLLSAVALICAFPVALAEDTAFFSDTIEDHTLYVPVGSLGEDYDNNVPGVASGKGDIFVPGVWQVSPMFGGGAWATDYRVRYDMQYANAWNGNDADVTTDKVISIKSISNDTSIQAAVNLIKDVSDVGDNFVYRADIRTYFNGNSTPVMGMRIADPENEANYYEIALFNNTGVANSKDEAKVSAPRFTKVKGADINTPAIAAEGSEPATWLYTKYGEEATASGLYPASPLPHHTEWFTLSLGRQGDVFSWTVTEKSTGEVIWKDKWEDASPLFEGVGRLQLFEYGGGNGSTFINNVVLDAVEAPVVTAPLDIFDDDIEDHPLYVPVGELGEDYDNNVPGVASGKNDVLVPDVWVTSPIFGGKSWSSDYRVRYDTWLGNKYTSKDYDLTDKVISIKSLAKDDRWQAAINRIGDVSEVGDSYIYSADLRSYFNGSSSLVMGMRIFDPTDETNYYEIALINNTGTAADKEAAKVSAPRFTKVQGGSDLNTPNVAEVGSEPATWLYTEYGTNKTASGIYKQTNGYETEWFTVKLGRQGNTFIWSVEEKETGEVIWTDSWTDANPLFAGCGTLQLFEYSGTEGGNGSTFINNVSLKKLGVEIYRESGLVTDRVSDDMQGHTVWETVSGNYGIDSDNGVPGVATGSGKTLATNWKTSEKFGGVSWATLYEVVYEQYLCNSYTTKDYLTDNIVLSMRPINDDSNRLTVLNYEIGTDDNADSYEYSAVLRNYFDGRCNPVMGIRLSNPDDETEYYELALFNNTGVADTPEEALVSPPRFTKVSGAVIDTPAMAESGAEPASWLYCEYGDEATPSGLYNGGPKGRHATDPYTLTIERNGDTFKWSVTNNCSGEVYWEDAWYDNDPLFDKTAKLQVFAYGDSKKTYVDDVSYVAKETGGIKMQSVWYNPSQLAPMLVVGNYDSTGRLVDCTVCPTTAGLFGEYKSGALEMTAETMKAFIWDGANLTPLAKESKFIDFKIATSEVTFPSYTKKAATFSFDGDADYNTQLAELMADYGINATFNLSAGSDNAIYKNNNFEIANGTTGAEIYLTEEYVNENGETVAPPTYEQSIASIEDAEASIGAKFVTPKGLAWAYMAPEERDFCDDLITYLTENGYAYARDIHTNGSLDVPENWMDWHQTAWMTADLKDEVAAYADKLAKMSTPAEFQILSVIDRTEGMEDADRLAAYETVFAKISDDGIWKATNLEISEYVKAAQQIEFTSTYAYNPTDVTVYLIINGNRYIALPQSYAVRAY